MVYYQEILQVLWGISPRALEDHDHNLVYYSLPYLKPMKALHVLQYVIIFMFANHYATCHVLYFLQFVNQCFCGPQ